MYVCMFGSVLPFSQAIIHIYIYISMYVCMFGSVLPFSQAILVDNTVGYMGFIGNGQSC